jgi:putative peptide maturation dehydrogenase
MNVKRSKYVAFFLTDGTMPDFSELLQGRIALRNQSMVLAASAIAEAESLLCLDEFTELQNIPSRSWVEASSLKKTERVMAWSKSGLLITDLSEDWASAYRQKEERLDSELWHCRSAVYHFLSKWKGVSLFPPINAEEADPYGFALQKLAEGAKSWEKLEPPPSPFWNHPRALSQIPLNPPERPTNSDLFDILLSRVSTRYFNPESALTLNDLSVLLYYAFAPLGTAKSAYTAIHKTSPSGGGLHPTEAYLLVRKVENLRPGLYHYLPQDHSLEVLTTFTEREAAERAVHYAAGQPYVLHVGALIIMASRFYRNHWKYRRNERTYMVMAMDIGHLGQTLYLLATKLDLGGFFTAAVNATDIESDLCLDGAQQGVMAMFAVGVKHPQATLEFIPFVSRRF